MFIISTCNVNWWWPWSMSLIKKNGRPFFYYTHWRSTFLFSSGPIAIISCNCIAAVTYLCNTTAPVQRAHLYKCEGADTLAEWLARRIRNTISTVDRYFRGFDPGPLSKLIFIRWRLFQKHLQMCSIPGNYKKSTRYVRWPPAQEQPHSLRRQSIHPPPFFRWAARVLSMRSHDNGDCRPKKNVRRWTYWTIWQ